MKARSKTRPYTPFASFLTRCAPYLALVISGLAMIGAAIAAGGTAQGIALLPVYLLGLVLTAACWRWSEWRRWSAPLGKLSHHIESVADDPRPLVDPRCASEIAELVRSLRKWAKHVQSASVQAYAPARPGSNSGIINESMTRSGMLATDFSIHDSNDGNQSGEYSAMDMVCRLDPENFRWLEASPGAQDFLGWNLEQLRRRTILDPVHIEDRVRVEQQLHEALARGEIHGLIVRIKTARGIPKAIEMNLSVRYAADLSIAHLRCHITDVTDKVRAERELRLRTRELTRVNEQLREINRELEDLKDRYRDLYQSAPAMYFSLDGEGRFIEVNDTLLTTLGYERKDLLGRSIEMLLPDSRRPSLASRIDEFLEKGSMEADGQWLKASGELIDVWITGTVVAKYDGRFLQSRHVAQDVTARHRLEAELKVKNEELAGTIDEISRKNKEMDEFTYVVSHDLQEPLRTLTAFSDFLLRDYGDRLDSDGEEYVRYIVDASRRMRALILGLLNLSRAGRVTGDFGAVNLEEVVTVVRADLGELIRSKGAEIRVVTPLPMLWGDRARIGQLVANLVTNALKYNQSAEPWVEVGVTPGERDGEVTLFVRDNGIGIEPQFHSKIFQLFRRLHTREEYEGTGAGLAICNKIVQAHKGKIWVESEPGNGSTFFVSLRPTPPLAHSSQHEVTHAP